MTASGAVLGEQTYSCALRQGDKLSLSVNSAMINLCIVLYGLRYSIYWHWKNLLGCKEKGKCMLNTASFEICFPEIIPENFSAHSRNV